VNDLIGHTLSVFLGFFAIMNPIANTPIFLGLTAGDSPQVTREVARNALLLTFVLIVIFCVLGRFIFEMFGITLPAFRITGGILVALIGYNMLHGEQSKVQTPSDVDAQDSLQTQLSVAVSPLAVPLLAGPGTIATAMNFAAAGGNHELAITALAFAVLCVITYFCFVFGQGMVRFLGQSGLNVVTRMMGLILAVIGVQMLVEGIKGAFAIGA
jgi:multiple antibiotic resistance protein